MSFRSDNLWWLGVQAGEPAAAAAASVVFVSVRRPCLCHPGNRRRSLDRDCREKGAARGDTLMVELPAPGAGGHVGVSGAERQGQPVEGAAARQAVRSIGPQQRMAQTRRAREQGQALQSQVGPVGLSDSPNQICS